MLWLTISVSGMGYVSGVSFRLVSFSSTLSTFVWISEYDSLNKLKQALVIFLSN
jgi:hypothetical protein